MEKGIRKYETDLIKIINCDYVILREYNSRQ